MNTNANIVEIYYLVDEFMKEFNTTINGHSLELKTSKNKRNRAFTMSDSEVITILILFHLKNYRTLKHFYIDFIQKYLIAYFPKTVSYNRFVELQKKVLLPMTLFLKMLRSGECTGISFIDSTPIRVCGNKRIYNHKTFKNIAMVGKSTIGYFYGFKLHIIINDKGEIINFAITSANIDDREPLKNESFINKIAGKLFGDKGYISQELLKNLFVDGIQLITGIKKNMKNQLMSLNDKILLRKRAVIESVNDELKNTCQIEHSRHRSLSNFFSCLISGLLAYSFLPKKPAIKYQTVKQFGQLVVF